MDKKFIGLNDEEVLKSREAYGSNKIPEPEPETFWEKFLGNLDDPMLKLLIAIAGIMIVMFFFGQAEIFEPIGTLVAIVLVASIGAKTELASDKAYKKLKDTAPKDTCKVHRNGVVSVILDEDVVVGDIVVLQSGDKIPADGILISGELRVNNAALNGETEECKKLATSEDTELPTQITGDTFVDKHSLFRGAVVYDGNGLMIIKKVGTETMMGKMAEDMNTEEPDSPLKVKLSKLANQISTFGYIGAIVLAVAYMLHFVIGAGGFANYINTGTISIVKDVMQSISLAIIIVVCAVPEGLPLMISLVLMSNTGALLKHNVLVRKPIGIETAGSLNVLFSDKTGTITKGVLEVVEFFNGEGTTIDIRNKNCKIRDYLNLAIGKNTGAMFDGSHNVVGGNMTDKALLQFLTEDIFNKLKDDENCIVTKQQNFNSANKFSSSYIESLGKTFYKGAPEKLLAKATKYIAEDGSIKELNKTVVDKKSLELAQRAMRLLAFAYSDKPLVENEINDDLILIGIVAIRDDIREESKYSIAECKKAGIQVVMITGDRIETAIAISKEAGLIESEEDIALTSEQLNNMSDDEIKEIFSKIKCIARALPTDKSRMVKIAHSLNLVAGMTGDGVNDSPALKNASVGFAMGLTGSDAAKQAADLVITDDNFRSIKDAILYGRTIYLNILKFVRYQLAINVAAVCISACLPILLNIDSPLTVIQLLFINLVMDGLGALLLGKEPARESYMMHPPKKRDESLISKNIFIQFVTMGLYITILSIVWFAVPFFRTLFENEAQFRTAYFAFFVFISIFNGFNVRTDKLTIFKDLDKNPNFLKVWFAMFGATALVCMISIIPVIGGVIGSMFSTTFFGLKGWIAVILLAASIIPIDLVRKIVFRTYVND